MTATSAGFGLQPTRNGLSGKATANEAVTIASAYGTAIFQWDPISQDPAGTGDITQNAGSGHALGVFDGCEYTTVDGYYRVRNGWTASTSLLSGTKATAYIFRDPFMEYFVQAAGTLAQTAIGFGADLSAIGSGNSQTLSSTSQLSTTLGTGTTAKQWRIVGLAPLLNNAWGDSYTIVRVVLNNISGSVISMAGVVSWV